MEAMDYEYCEGVKINLKRNDDDDDDDDDDESSTDEEVISVLDYRKNPDDPDQTPAEEWIQAHLPSNIDREKSGIYWIHVARPRTQDLLKYLEGRDPFGLVFAWEQIVKSGRPINFNLILELAGTYRVTCGKWMFFAQTGAKIDVLWPKIALKVIEDETMPLSSAKVSTWNDSEDTHVVCIYNNDFRNKDQLLELEQAIRNAGIKCMLRYKPDIYTYIGVYKKNPWGLRPTILESQFDIKTGCSVITSDVFEL